MAFDDGTLATARVKLVADARGMPDDVRQQTQKQLGDAGEKAGNTFGKRMSLAIGAALAVGAAVVGRKLVAGLKESIAAASDLNEITSKVGVVFGASAKDIEKFASTASTKLGQTRAEALNAAATFAVFGKGANLSGKNLVNFSTKLVTTATDMASFSNTTPTEAITAIGSALRGEFDPIERYGVLLNANSVQAEALSLGLLKGTVSLAKVRAAQLTATVAQHRYNDAVKEHGKDSDQARAAQAGMIRAQEGLKAATAGTTGTLTSQQRVLAVQSLILKQTSDAQGDFARTSAGLANQQRILKSQFEDLKTSIGQALLPVVLKFTTVLTSKLMPLLQKLWEEHGPAVIRVLDNAAVKFGEFAASINVDKIRRWGEELSTALANVKAQAGPALKTITDNIGPAGESIRQNLIPALKQLRESGGTTLADGLKVTGVALKFLADHTELLARALPILVTAMVAYKVAQLGSNIALAASPVLRVLEIQATRRQTTAIIANTAARGTETGATIAGTVAEGASTTAENRGIIAKSRAIVVSTAQRVATIAGTVATWLATAATTALGVAVRLATGPIGIIITVIGVLTAAVIYAYKHNETFRKIVDATWKAVKIAIKATIDWFVNTAWPLLKRTIDALVAEFRFFLDIAKTIWGAVRAYIKIQVDIVMKVFNGLKNFIMVTLPAAFRAGVAAIKAAWALVQAAARVPVVFVVDHVINPLINGFNTIAGVFGVKPVSTIKLADGGQVGGFEDGGQIAGAASSTDNRWAWLRDARGRVLGQAGLATGEFVVNARDTAKALPLLRWINNGMKGGADSARDAIGRPLTDMPGDGSEGYAFAKGGLVGFLKDVWGAITNPAELIKRPIEAMLKQIPGGGLLKDVLLGMGHKLIGGLISFLGGGGSGGSGSIGKAQTFLRAQNGKPYVWASAGPGGYDCSGIVSAVYNLLHGKNPYSHTFSTGSLPGGFFPKKGFGGPLTAAWAHPGQRPASSSTGHMMGMVGGLTFESTGSRGVHLGGTTRRLTDFANIGHYDRGGIWPTGTLGINTSGRNEVVASGATMDDVAALLGAVVAILSKLAPDLAAALSGTFTAGRTLARAGATTR